MQQLGQDIENRTFKRCYLLYGDEDYLRKQYKDKLLKALVTEGDTMNFNRYEGKDINIGEVIDQAETMPFFADKRVIYIEDSGLLKSGGEQLADYLSQSARKWILGKIKKEGKSIDIRALDILLERTGTDMTTISTELEKLFSYTMNKDSISTADVEDIVTVSTSSKVFDMISAMAEKKQSAALEMYHDLLAHKETPFGILALITRQFNMMLQISELLEGGSYGKRIAETLSIPSFAEQKYERQLKNFSKKTLRNALDACAAADENVKIKGMLPELSVELLIIEYSTVNIHS